jgi:hypothetical protein
MSEDWSIRWKNYWQVNMLAYFPVPYKDELLYSVIARYGVHTGQVDNQKAILKDLYGKTSAVAIPDLPSHLEYFRQNIQTVWQVTVKEIIKRHTLAPIYLPFLPPILAKKIIESMRSAQGGNIHTRCGISASKVPQPQYFRYCPVCVTEQLDIIGEIYWQRAHQIPGINICFKHKCCLVSSGLAFHPKQKHLYRSASKSCIECKPDFVETQNIELLLILRFHELINLGVLTGYSAYQWTLFYRNLAKKLGLMNKTRVDHAAVHDLLSNHWGNTAYSHYLYGKKNSWSINIFRKHRKAFNPLRHLMVWSSLMPDMSTKKIFASVKKLPKNAPEKAVVCVTLGFPGNQLTQEKRRSWMKLKQNNLGVGINEIRAISPGGSIYAWLYRHDYAWLMGNRPPRARDKENHYGVDYVAWDRDCIPVLHDFKSTYAQKLNRQRMTRTLFIKQLPRANSVEKHLNDLPETYNWLLQNSESLEEFQIYRINKVARALIEQHLPIKKWRLLRLAGIRLNRITPRMNHLIQKLETEGNTIDRY